MHRASPNIALAFAVIALSATPASTQQSLLPITPGAWVEDHEQCAAASRVWAFDGRRSGHLFYYANQRVSREPQGEMEAITLVKAVRNGFTEFKPASFGELGRMRVKATGADRATLVMVAPARDGMHEDEQSLKRCSYGSLSPRIQVALQRFAPSLVTSASPAAATTTPVSQGARWQVAAPTNGAPMTAYVEGPAAMNALGLRCRPDGNIAIFASAPGQRMDRPLVAAFLSPASGANVPATLGFEPRSRLFWGNASSTLVSLLAGSDAALDLRLNEKHAGQLSLGGSSAAISSALGPCLGLRTAQPGTTPPSLAPLPPLGIAAGYYVDEGTSCTDPIEAFYYDGRRAGVIFSEGGTAPGPIGRVRKERGEFFLPNEEILVKVLGPARVQLTIQDTGGPMRLCPASQIPQSIRRLVR